MCESGSRVTWEGCSVLLDINDGDRLVFARLSPSAKLKIGNKNCSLQPLIGRPFGTAFQVDGPYLSPAQGTHAFNGNNAEELRDVQVSVKSRDKVEDNYPEEERDVQANVDSRDNRELVDNNTAQRLTGEDIEACEGQQGAGGNEIIEALIANSVTFEKKTSFSQEKYRLKKQKKYAPKVLMRRPVARSICEAYFKKYPSKIGFLRVDTLSLLLSMGNVSSNSDILVVDMIGGLLTGAVAERLGGTGFVCNSYSGQAPYSMDIVRIFNLSDEICKRIVRSPISDLLSQKELPEQTLQHDDACNVESRSTDQMSASTSMEDNSHSLENGISDLGAENTEPAKVRKAPKAGERAHKEIIDLWKENGFSSLIIAAPELDTWALVRDVLPLLANSAPFAIYHQYLQPLATCMHNLQLEKMAIGLQITEPWLREYQVLPSRTHPCMQMSSFGGYILSGTKICST
ncbi:tRNA (adenine(58)-N(1))-methyltransferase non-catalytic subunit trm6 [Glycine max]|nr:tRNA (adenine(58)-N(1))-methyltransferase non-catalytic subunit trm6 [Glycine max]